MRRNPPDASQRLRVIRTHVQDPVARLFPGRKDRGRHFEYTRLMTRRVRNILLVASLYDSYVLAEDGQLTELILREYVDLNLRYAPRVTWASSASEALDFLDDGPFDLVLAMSHLSDMPAWKFRQAVERRHAELPVVLLCYHHADVARLIEASNGACVGRTFLWTGDARILLAICKLIEDRWNLEEDTLRGVRVIILTEDSVRFYSSYLPIIYTELVGQTQSLMAEGLNTAHRMLRQAARPKILLASSYEEATELFARFKDNVLGVISDVRFPMNGVPDATAGIQFIEQVRRSKRNLPVLLQSSNTEFEARARELNTSFLYKLSPLLLNDLRRYMKTKLGFGEFVWRTPDEEEVLRVKDLRGLEASLAVIPDDSLLHHAKREQLSNWAFARTEFAVAGQIQRCNPQDFDSITDFRKALIQILKKFRAETQAGVVAEFSRAHFDSASVFVKIGGGSMGGKARGLAFIASLIERFGIQDYFDGVRLSVPNTAVVATDVFDQFIEENNLLPLLMAGLPDAELSQRLLSARLPEQIYGDLRAYLDLARYPLAVRSSSLLEDSHSMPFAGVYDTHMLVNSHADPAVRLDQLCDAIKLVYASAFFRKSREYMDSTPHRSEEEKMAVVIQQLVGKKRGSLFYPHFSGVARSYNHYPYGKASPEDGVCHLALGFGRTIVDGERSLRFCPEHPKELPQFGTVESTLDSAQKHFYAIDLRHPEAYPAVDTASDFQRRDLDDALEHGSLDLLGSIYSPENEAIYDGVARPGIPLVTFANVLKGGNFPLADIVRLLLEMGQRSISLPVEIEFAVSDLHSPGPVEFCFLQLRPLARSGLASRAELELAGQDGVILESPMVMGHGSYPKVDHIIQIRPEHFNRARTRQIADEVGRFNAGIRKRGGSSLIIGPGRWGTADEWLGIPVSWGQISSARMIAEVSLEGFPVAPSQGAHFFQNLVSFNVCYMTIADGQPGHSIDWDWFEDQPIVAETEFVRWLEPTLPIHVLVNGQAQRGLACQSPRQPL